MINAFLILAILLICVIAYCILSFIDFQKKEAKIKEQLNIIENKFNCLRTFIFTLSGPTITTLSRSDSYKLTIENEICQNVELIKDKFQGVHIMPLTLYLLAYTEKSHGSNSNRTGDIFFSYGVRSYLVTYIKKRWCFRNYYYFLYLGWSEEGKLTQDATTNAIWVQSPLLSKHL